MGIFQKSIVDGDEYNVFGRGMAIMHLGEFTLRADYRYLDLRTNIGNNNMLYAVYMGYLYNRGNCFGFWGGYPYENTLIINNYGSNMVSTTSNVSDQTILTSAYRATSANSYGTCFKFDSKSNGYSEGKINFYIGNHYGPGSSWAVVAYAQNNVSGNFY